MSHHFEHPFALVKGESIVYNTAKEAAANAKTLNRLVQSGALSGGERRVYVDFELVKRILLPFAEMHRPGCKEDEVACQRGVASDLTMLTSLDFQQAARLLGPEFEKELIAQHGDGTFGEKQS